MTEYQTIAEQKAPSGVGIVSYDAPKQDAETQPIEDNEFALHVTEALNAGASREQISIFLQKSQGLKPEDADFAIVDTVSQKIKQAQDAGANENQIREHLIQSNYDANIVEQAFKVSTIQDGWKQFEYKPTEQSKEAQNLMNTYENVHSKYSTLAKQITGLYDPIAQQDANKDITDLNTGIFTELRNKGINAYIDGSDIVMKDADGTIHKVDDSTWQAVKNGIENSKFEAYGAAAGGSIGATIGSIIPGIGTLIGALGGSGVGATAGRGIDLLINSTKLKNKLTTQQFLSQMGQAGIMDIGTGIALNQLAKPAMFAYKRYIAGNAKGAVQYLQNTLNMTKEQAADITSDWERMLTAAPKIKSGLFFKTERKMTPEEKTIAAITSTQQGLTGEVAKAAVQSPRLGNVIKEDINKRAKALQQSINNITDPNVGKLVREDLNSYSKDVKDFYAQVKQIGIDAIKGTDFSFNIDDTTIKPIIENMQKNISNFSDLQAQERFMAHATKIANASANRSFGGLIDLRQAVNEFKYSKLLKPDALEGINKVLNKIDAKIAKAAHQYIRNSKQWLENFKLAKSEYNQMKLLEENKMFKEVTNKDVTEEHIQKSLSKFANGKDVDAIIFNDVVERLSPRIRSKVEGAAIKNLAEKSKFTLGKETDMQAIHFPMLANELNQLNISTPEAKNLISTVNEMAKVFKNDADLSGISTGTAFEEIQSAMSSNLLQKAKYTLASKTWDSIIRNLPFSEKARGLALTTQLKKLLDNPLNVKTTEDFLRNIPIHAKDEMHSLVKDLQIQIAKQGRKQQNITKMYQKSTSGNPVTSSGALGKGIYIYNKVANPGESKIISHPVNMSKMATLKDISELIGKEVTEKDLRVIPDLHKQLIDAKFLGITLEDKAMLFPETFIKGK